MRAKNFQRSPVSILDEIYAKNPKTEVGLVVFSNRLAFDYRDNNLFKKVSTLALGNDSYLPLAPLDDPVKGVDSISGGIVYPNDGDSIWLAPGFVQDAHDNRQDSEKNARRNLGVLMPPFAWDLLATSNPFTPGKTEMPSIIAGAQQRFGGGNSSEQFRNGALVVILCKNCLFLNSITMSKKRLLLCSYRSLLLFDLF